ALVLSPLGRHGASFACRRVRDGSHAAWAYAFSVTISGRAREVTALTPAPPGGWSPRSQQCLQADGHRRCMRIQTFEIGQHLCGRPQPLQARRGEFLNGDALLKVLERQAAMRSRI